MPVELIGILPWNDGTHTIDLSQDFGSGLSSRLVGFDTGLGFCSGTGLDSGFGTGFGTGLGVGTGSAIGSH